MDPLKRDELVKSLASRINYHSVENGSNTPDFLLAEYLVSCLESFDKACNSRTKWYSPEESIDAPLEKAYCGDSLSDHYWIQDETGEPTYCDNCPTFLSDLAGPPSIDEKVLWEDAPLEKSVYDNESCGDFLKDHVWAKEVAGWLKDSYCVRCLWPYRDIEALENSAGTLDKILSPLGVALRNAADTVEKAVEDINFCNHCLERIEMWQIAGVELRKQMRVDNEKAEELGKALESVITKAKLDEAIEQFEAAMSNYYSVAPEKALGVLTRALEKTESLCGKDETQRPIKQHKQAQ